MADNFCVWWTKWPNQTRYYQKSGDFNFDIDQYTQTDKSTFDNKTQHRIKEFIECYKIKKGEHAGSKIKIKHKGKYKTTTDKKNGRPKPWVIKVIGDGLTKQQATEIYENTPWLMKEAWRQEWWEPSPVAVPGWFKNVYDHFAGKMDENGQLAQDPTPAITSVNIQWQTHDGGEIEPSDSETIVSVVVDNKDVLTKNKLNPVRSYEWSNNAGEIVGTDETFSVIASEWNTGDVITLTVKLKTNDTDEVVSAATFTLPTVKVPEPVVPVVDAGEPAVAVGPVDTAEGGSEQVDVQAAEPGTFGDDISLPFDGVKTVDTVATEVGDVVVNTGGSVVPSDTVTIQLDGGEEPLPELPSTNTGPLSQLDDYILLRYAPTNYIELPIASWFELVDVDPIEVDWDYMDTHNGGAGDREIVTLATVATGETTATNPGTDDPSSVWVQDQDNNHIVTPESWKQYSDWDPNLAKFPNDSDRRITHGNHNQNKVTLMDPHVTGLRGAVKTWTGTPKPRIVLIKNTKYLSAYGISLAASANALKLSNDKLNYVKIKGCGNVREWKNSFAQAYHNDMSNLPEFQVDVTEWTPTRIYTMDAMFSNSRIVSFDASHLRVLLVEYLNNIFNGCKRLTTCKFPRIYDEDNNTTVTGMFYNCTSLTSFDLHCLDDMATKGSLDMSNMFYGCTSLVEVDMSYMNFNAANVSRIFFNCTSLATITGWHTSSFYFDQWNIVRDMFKNCSSLTDSAIPNLDNMHPVDNARRYIDPNQWAHLNQTNFDNYGTIGSGRGFTAQFSMDMIETPNELIKPPRWREANVNWDDAMVIDVDLNLSPDVQHADTWAPGTDLSDLQVPATWNTRTIEFWLGNGIGYNTNCYDVLIDWGDGTVEWCSSFNHNNDPAFVNQANYEANGRAYYTTNHTYVSHKYAARGKYTIKVLGQAPEFVIGGKIRNTNHNNNVWSWLNSAWCVTDIKSYGKFSTEALWLESWWLKTLPATWSPAIHWIRVENMASWSPKLARLHNDSFNTGRSLFGWNKDKPVTQDSFVGVTGWPDASGSPSENKSLEFLWQRRPATYYMTKKGDRKTWYNGPNPSDTLFQNQAVDGRYYGDNTPPVAGGYPDTSNFWNDNWTGKSFEEIGGVARQIAGYPDEYFLNVDYGNAYSGIGQFVPGKLMHKF